MYKVIGHPANRTFRVIWMLEELDIGYEIEPVSVRSEAAIKYNPTGKVPMLSDDGDVIIDSAAILQYLADKYGRLTFPAGTPERAQQDSWLFFALDEIESTLWYSAKHTFILPEELRSKQAREACQMEFHRGIKALETRLGDKTYVMGDTFTVPDIILGHCAGWATISAGWEVSSDTVTKYFERVRSRPAFKRASAIKQSYEDK